MAPTSIVTLPAAESEPPIDARALAQTIRPEFFTERGDYARGELMTYLRAWELGISEAVALEAGTLPGGGSFYAGQPLEPACNFPMDGTEPHAGTWVLEMVPRDGGRWVNWNRVPREAFACTENVPAEITPAQAQIYLSRMTDGEAVRAVREHVEKERGEDDLPHPIATPEPDPIEGAGDVWAEVIADTKDPTLRALFEARRQFGIDKYKRPLQRNNGRAHPNDLRQEIADGVVYARAADMPATEAVLIALLAGGEDAARALLNRENEDGISLLEYQNQIDDIADYLDAIDPHNDARDEDHTTAQQVIAILRRVVGQGDLSAALKPHPPCDGLAVEIVELGGVEPHVMLGARISRETAQRLGRSPGLYGRVTVLLPGDEK
jgi:hypothetical protein